MVSTLPQSGTATKGREGIVDCDVHPMPAHIDEIRT